MELHDLRPAKGSKKAKKRVGRGTGSGLGTTAGKGTKGQKARSGGGVRPGFEGGQMPLYRRLPKRGFSNKKFATVYEIVNLNQLEMKYSDGEIVNIETLKEKSLIKGNKDGVKVLGNGELTKKLIIDVDKISGSAAEKVKKVGGEIKGAE
ncbi:50S ribosomal protein L15 [Deferribacter desulfuricans SSM1]|uniref:Large ribosomal subunit protein uL15 n=1 Tax=Deferribacter desulfuricans (strain DSM 14783 / JCM 11476 / NBRC 101012 / SSM1) TaxID=639282 RepID=D3P919_DEFDS|nr:50S ribosomal protein L15 [Deferribacter desulfuricans]BAI81209.1 50S ribosomal protein L15 [Deferribacter desulfuricans SSM1]